MTVIPEVVALNLMWLGLVFVLDTAAALLKAGGWLHRVLGLVMIYVVIEIMFHVWLEKVAAEVMKWFN